MQTPKGFYQDEAKAAINGWRTALSEIMPPVRFDQHLRDAAKTMLDDPRVAQTIFDQRKAFHMGHEGLDEATARKLAAQDITQFVQAKGGK
jgi:hypothetical protein